MTREKARVAALISGRGSNMAALIEAARDPACPFAVTLVVSNVPDAPGLAIAHAAGIATAARPHQGLKRAAFDDWIEEQLTAADIEWVALAGYMRLLSPGFIAGRAGRILNVHPSLLPAYKGLDTHQRAIDAGEPKAGCSIHIVTAELDDGPVLAQAEVPILPGDTADTLAARVLVEEHALYPRALAAHIMAVRSEER
jgi:formyltetrahydrofolate-dependent phosphoribosylglycinamide formyltransferase